MGRAELVEKNKAPPFIVHLPPKRALKLVAELKEMNVSFGVPFNGFVPDPKEEGTMTLAATRVMARTRGSRRRGRSDGPSPSRARGGPAR